MIEHTTEIRPLNGLRGIAALAVALGHYHIGNLLPVLSIFCWKDAAVDLFFCLSGFTMCLAYKAGSPVKLPFRNYFVARMARIYPLYLLTLVIASLVAKRPTILTEYDYHVILWDYVRQMAMVNAWSVISSGMHWNFPAWSVSVEFFCYVFVFPALFAVMGGLLRLAWPIRLILSTLLVAGSWYVFMNYYNWFILMYGRDPRGGIPEIAFSVNLIRGILGFTAGWTVYASYVSRDRLWSLATRHADIVTLGILAVLISGKLGFSQVQLMIFGFPLLILGVSSGTSWTSRFLSWAPIHYLGNISYSVYLLHIPWFHFGLLRAGLFDVEPTRRLSSSIVLLGGLIGLAALSYHFVEMPARRMIRAAWQTQDSRTPNGAKRRMGLVRIAVIMLVAAIGVGEADRVGVFRPIPPLQVGVGDEVTRFPTFEQVKGDGWSNRENWGIWSIGPESSLTIPLAKGALAPLKLWIKGSFYLNERHASLVARITVNDIEIGRFTPTAANNTIETALPLPAVVLPPSGGLLRIKFWIASPASPKSLGISEDSRGLGFGLVSMKLVDDKSP